MIEERHQFASDNVAAICPEAWAASQEANAHYAPSYGEDYWTARVCDRIREIFETDCDVYFVFTGTAANALALAQVCKSFHSIICHQHSHIQSDECGAGGRRHAAQNQGAVARCGVAGAFDRRPLVSDRRAGQRGGALTSEPLAAEGGNEERDPSQGKHSIGFDDWVARQRPPPTTRE